VTKAPNILILILFLLLPSLFYSEKENINIK
jgi:hypothetical protein